MGSQVKTFFSTVKCIYFDTSTNNLGYVPGNYQIFTGGSSDTKTLKYLKLKLF